MTNDSAGLKGSIPIESIPWDSSWPELSRSDERRYLLDYLHHRFGILPRVFDGYFLFRRKKAWFLLQNSPQLVHASQLKISKAGLRAFQKVGHFIKPTTRLIQSFGRHATKGTCQVDEKQFKALLRGEEIPVDFQLAKGYVMLTLGTNRILGLGFFHNHAIRSQLPQKELTSHVMI
ncbi:MAG: hypothetical protein R6U38_07910 [Desulfatiglandaceae bacterium]